MIISDKNLYQTATETEENFYDKDKNVLLILIALLHSRNIHGLFTCYCKRECTLLCCKPMLTELQDLLPQVRLIKNELIRISHGQVMRRV